MILMAKLIVLICFHRRALGQVLQSLGESTVATDCLMTALELEQTDPILPFTIIHRVCT